MALCHWIVWVYRSSLDWSPVVGHLGISGLVFFFFPNLFWNNSRFAGSHKDSTDSFRCALCPVFFPVVTSHVTIAECHNREMDVGASRVQFCVTLSRADSCNPHYNRDAERFRRHENLSLCPFTVPATSLTSQLPNPGQPLLCSLPLPFGRFENHIHVYT